MNLYRKPSTFGDKDFFFVFRYLCQHSLFRYLHHFFQNGFTNYTECSATLFSYIILFLTKKKKDIVSVNYLQFLYIFGTAMHIYRIFRIYINIDEWAITLSFKDGCFQADLLVVFALRLPFSLSNFFRTLTNVLGCFPLVLGPSHPRTVSLVTLLPRILSFLYVGDPSQRSALPQDIFTKGSTYIDFAENQLFPSLIGLSPLITSHPRLLPQTWVRSSSISPSTCSWLDHPVSGFIP